MAVSRCHWPTYWCRMALAHNSSLFLFCIRISPNRLLRWPERVEWTNRGRTGCDFSKNGSSSCQTGSCGSSINRTMDLTLSIVIKPTSDVACLPTNYPKSFKQVCPVASSYAYKEANSLVEKSISLETRVALMGQPLSTSGAHYINHL
ncbi:hypothetical protein Gotur_021377 [Gossypium turneri]